ncbi:hypothetical protein EI94DRAFT_1726772 [Lactarius quietus]|nr:hypothetical protein EI94DRAFT_1726772 [Lactarius quietus]
MSDEQYLAVLKASYDYVPQSGDEIEIKEDQLLLLVEKSDDDWWKVKVKGDDQSGLVPSAYVESAEHSSVVKAQYDYDAAADGELSVKEDQLLLVFGPEEDGWFLVQDKVGGRVGYVPGNYIESVDDANSTVDVPSATPQIVVPDSPPRRPRPISTYVDPAELVRSTASKAKADTIKTWAISEVDKKGKKKKGTLGVGNGAIFFASEADKTPVQKWQIGDITSADIDKSKHILIEVGGAVAASLHFHAGNKDTAEEILTKLESSRSLARASIESAAASAAAAEHQADPDPEPETAPPQPPVQRTLPPPLVTNGSNSPGKKGVHFSEASPAIIPPRPPSPPEPEQEEVEGLGAVALYDFQAQGDDELNVTEGDALWVIEQEGDEWWKCRNAKGDEGVVPASYIEPTGAGRLPARPAEPEDEEDDGSAEREVEERAVAERAEREAKEARELKDRQAQEQRAKATAAAAEVERKRKEKEKREREERDREDLAKREKEREEEDDGEETRRGADDKRATKSVPKTVRSPKPEGRKSVEKRAPPDPSQTREWRDRSGQFRVEAAFLGFKNGVLRLHKVNGVVIEVPSEKMSVEDIRYVEKMSGRGGSASRKGGEEDDEPLAKRRQSLQTTPAPTKKAPSVDWFEFFLNAGCDVDDCTRYAASFERDKIDEAILPDITEGTLRTLGLREGDIIRVNKLIDARRPKPSVNASSSDVNLLGADESGTPARATPSPGAPNLFTGPGGQLKNARRGRPAPGKTSSTAPGAVDLTAISTASEQIARSTTPLVTSPAAPPAPPALVSSPAQVPASGFDDDAWTNRPSSTKPVAPTPPIPERAPSVPALNAAALSPVSAPTPPQPPRAPSAPVTQVGSSIPTSASAGGGLAKTDADIFDQLARLSQLRVQTPSAGSAPNSAPPVPSPAIVSPPAASGYNRGLGASPAPPLGPHPTLSLPIQSHPTGFSPSAQPGPRGPFAPVPANQGLLAPLVPTSTGFTGFVPTRPATSPSFLGTQPTGLQPQPTGFQGFAPQPTGFQSTLAPQPTGFQPGLAPQPTGFQSHLAPQPTGFQPSLAPQPTGYGGGSPFGAGQFGGVPPVPPLPGSFQNGSFAQLQPQPTGFNPGFSQPSYGNGNGFGGGAPPQPGGSAQKETNPANVFAAMKAGTFANDSAPQSAGEAFLHAVDRGWAS